MLKHAVDQHEGEDTRLIDFRMKILRFHRFSFERQISEAVSIQYTREGNSLPRLVLKIGSRNYSKNQKEGEEEEETEKTIQDKIRNLRKMEARGITEGGDGKRTRTQHLRGESWMSSEERKVEQLVKYQSQKDAESFNKT